MTLGIGLTQGPMVVLGGWAFSYERGAPVVYGHVGTPEMQLSKHKSGRMDQWLHVTPHGGRERRRRRRRL